MRVCIDSVIFYVARSKKGKVGKSSSKRNISSKKGKIPHFPHFPLFRPGLFMLHIFAHRILYSLVYLPYLSEFAIFLALAKVYTHF